MPEQLAPDWAPVPVRLAVGGVLAYHGAPKLFSRRGHENIASMVRTMGVPLPDEAAWGIGVIEFVGGLALVAGLRTRAVSGLVVGEVVINLLNALRRGGFPQPLPGGQPLPGVQTSLVIGACSLSLIKSGGGRWSLDLRRRSA